MYFYIKTLILFSVNLRFINSAYSGNGKKENDTKLG